jgi:Zn-dependent peptidase ImmA (M78 family)
VTVKWERFCGSTDLFAVRLSFMPDPDQNLAADVDEAASWGALQIWIDGQNLCAHVDQGEVLQSVHWYLLPFLEWLADAWNPLLHEEKLPNRNAAESAALALAATRTAPPLATEADSLAWDEEWYEWRARHALRTARNGGLLPNVVFRRLRDLVEVSWEDEHLAGTPQGFHFSAARGVVRVAPELVAGPLWDLATAACSYLLRNNPGSERLGLLQENLAALARPVHHDVRLGCLAGLRTSSPLTQRLRGQSVEQEIQDRWPEIVAALRELDDGDATNAALATEEATLVLSGSCQAALLFGSVAPTVSEKDVRTLAQVLIEQYQPVGSKHKRLAALSEDVPLDPSLRAWEQGYELAESLHDVLQLDREPVDIQALLRELDISVLDRTLEDLTVRGCSIVGPQHRPTVVTNGGSPYAVSDVAVRFTLAHELCHILHDRSHGRRLAIASGPWAPRGIERRANAFAAMFLMPSVLVRQAIADSPDPISDLNGVIAVAQRLRVSRRAAVEHLYNLTLMSEATRDELLGRGYAES